MLRSILHRRSPLPLHSILNPTINPSSTPNLSSSPSQFPPIFRYFSTSHQNQDETTFRDPDAPPRLFVVQPRLRPQTHLKAKLEEALNLANSLEQQRPEFAEAESTDREMPPHVIVQNPAAKSPRADTYFGRGTVETVKCHINNLDEDEVDAIFVNATLRGVQQRNLETAWGKPVLDRVGLIIQIFNAHAQTKEAKLQAELAALVCKRSRLVRVRGPDGRSTFGGVWGSGDIEVVSARGRGSGGRGFISGAGETEIQLQRGRILERKKRLLAEISEVRRTRAMQRNARKRRESLPGQDLPTVAIVGYTNAGKSTLVSKVSNSYLYSDDRLFATVDPKLRSVRLPSGRKVLLSDTVGFISDLPVQLVEAFHATLEEVIEADLLVHVLDSSASNLDENRESVLQVLRKINVAEEKLQNMIEVWNKVDLLEEKSEMPELDDGPVDEDADVIFGQHDDSEEDDEDADVTSGHHGENQDIECEEEDVCHEIIEDPEDWLSVVDEQESRVSYNVSSTTAAIATDKGTEFRPESLEVVKTSAVTGVGLQELLELIDDKLKRIRVVERSSFDRKWRPPRGDKGDSDIAIQQ